MSACVICGSEDGTFLWTSLLSRLFPDLSNGGEICKQCHNLTMDHEQYQKKLQDIEQQLQARHRTPKVCYECPHSEGTPQKCHQCNKTFKIREKHEKHERKCKQGFQCNQCPNMFVSQRNLRDHINVIHTKSLDLRKYSCPHCSKQFYKSSNLASHLMVHSTTRSFACKECKKTFKRERTLRNHISTQHTTKKQNFLCTFCGKSFLSLSGMRLHSSKHTGEAYGKRESECPICNKTFRCTADLEIHKVVHTKQKPYKCDQCEAAFSQKATLRDHWNVHQNIFQCVICQKSFARNRYLQNHQKVCSLSKEVAETTQKDFQVTDSILVPPHSLMLSDQMVTVMTMEEDEKSEAAQVLTQLTNPIIQEEQVQ